jgi:hypothetical protein
LDKDDGVLLGIVDDVLPAAVEDVMPVPEVEDMVLPLEVDMCEVHVTDAVEVLEGENVIVLLDVDDTELAPEVVVDDTLLPLLDDEDVVLLLEFDVVRDVDETEEVDESEIEEDVEVLPEVEVEDELIDEPVVLLALLDSVEPVLLPELELNVDLLVIAMLLALLLLGSEMVDVLEKNEVVLGPDIVVPLPDHELVVPVDAAVELVPLPLLLLLLGSEVVETVFDVEEPLLLDPEGDNTVADDDDATLELDEPEFVGDTVETVVDEMLEDHELQLGSGRCHLYRLPNRSRGPSPFPAQAPPQVDAVVLGPGQPSGPSLSNHGLSQKLLRQGGPGRRPGVGRRN